MPPAPRSGPELVTDAPLIRAAAPIRVAFVHTPLANGGPGPLSWLVRSRRGVALDLLLLAHAAAPAVSGPNITRPSRTWAAALGLHNQPGTRALISRSWSWLEAHDLIRSRRVGQTRSIELLREDGSGGPYVHPAEELEPYFQLPHDYWEHGWHRRLTLAAKAALLIALSLQAGRERFGLPTVRGAAWYGLSTGTLSRGIRELRTAGLLWMSSTRRASEASGIGYVYDRTYQLRDLGAVGRSQGAADVA
jgi:hypothetical protein